MKSDVNISMKSVVSGEGVEGTVISEHAYHDMGDGEDEGEVEANDSKDRDVT